MNSSWLAGSPFLIGNSNYVGNSQVAENEAGNNKEQNEKTSSSIPDRGNDNWLKWKVNKG